MEPSIQNLNKSALNNGLILAVISFVLNILVYYVSPASMGSTWFGLCLLVVSLALYIAFILDLRKKIGGFWSFREALQGIFLMVVIAGLVDSVLRVIFYKFIEPGAYEKISGFVVSNLSRTYENMGMDQEKIDTIVAKVQESMKSQFNPGIFDFFKTLGIMLLIEFILSLIFAAIFKKQTPVFAETEEE